MTKAILVNYKDNESKEPAKHTKTLSWPLVSPKTHGNKALEMMLTETEPGGGAEEVIHPGDSEHLYYVISGEAIAMVDGEKYKLEPGSCLYMEAGAKHGFTVIGDEKFSFLVLFAPAR